MPTTLIKSRLHSNKQERKIKQEPNKAKTALPPNLQLFKQNFLSESVF